MERTLAVIKPNAIAKNCIGKIVDRFESNDLKIVAIKKLHLTQAQARAFYAIHEGKPFFERLVGFMSSGAIVAMVLEGENAISKSRELIGATNPKEAKSGTIRADFADSLEENAIHGSDSIENAKSEISFFFKQEEIL